MSQYRETDKETLRAIGKAISTEEGRAHLKSIGYVSGTMLIAVHDKVRTSRVLNLVNSGKDVFVAVVAGGFLVDGFLCSGKKS